MRWTEGWGRGPCSRLGPSGHPSLRVPGRHSKADSGVEGRVLPSGGPVLSLNTYSHVRMAVGAPCSGPLWGPGDHGYIRLSSPGPAAAGRVPCAGRQTGRRGAGVGGRTHEGRVDRHDSDQRTPLQHDPRFLTPLLGRDVTVTCLLKKMFFLRLQTLE